MENQRRTSGYSRAGGQFCAAGDQIQIEKGDGTKITYQVVKKTLYPYNNVDMSQVLAPVDPNKSGLTLMTCSGDVIPHTNTFNQRVAIFAEEI